MRRGLVDVWRQHALAQVVQNRRLRRATESPEGLLVQLRPDLGARLPREQVHRLPAVPQHHREEPRPPVLPRLGIQHQRAFAPVHLALLAGRRDDDRVRLLRRLIPAQRPHVPLHRLVRRGEAVVVHELLVDGHRVAPALQGFTHEGLMRRAQALGWCLQHVGLLQLEQVGGHFVGRICARPPIGVGGHFIGRF